MATPNLNAIKAWDTNTAAAVIVLGALALIVAVRAGFRPVLVSR